MAKWTMKFIEIRKAPKKQLCHTCHDLIGETAAALCGYQSGRGRARFEWHCWKCEHSAEGTLLFVQKYPLYFEREQRGPWWYVRIVGVLRDLIDG